MIKLFLYILFLLAGIHENSSIAGNTDFSGGEGIQGNPWQITTALQLDKIRDNNGSDAGLKYFKLMNDIDLKDLGEINNWKPINTNGAFMDLDGNGHVIKNLHISTGTTSTPNYQSFVGVLFGIIKNLGLANVYIDAPKIGNVGAFTGYVGAATPAEASIRTGIIENSFASGYLSSGGGAVGGITGFIGRPANDGTPSYIKNCYFAGEIYNSYAGSASTVYTGGIAGGVKANENVQTSEPDTLNIVSYNVKVFSHNPSYPKGNYQVIANVLKELKPDVVCLQELDSVNSRSNGVFQIKELANLNLWNFRFGATIPYKGGSYGIGLVSPHPIVKSTFYKVSSIAEQRGFLIVEFAKYIVISIHLGGDEPTRQIQAQQVTAKIKELYANSGKPIFLGGDFNSTPLSDTMKELNKDWITLTPLENTVSGGNRTIDYILMLNQGGNYKILESKVIEHSESGNIPVESDHLPVMVTIVIS